MIVTLVFKHRIVHFLKDNVRKPGQVLIAVRYFNFHTSKSEEIVVCECQYGVFGAVSRFFDAYGWAGFCGLRLFGPRRVLNRILGLIDVVWKYLLRRGLLDVLC